MSDRNTGLQFIPNPTGSALTDKEFLSSAIDQQAEKDHQSAVMAGGALILALCGVAVLFVSFRRRLK